MFSLKNRHLLMVLALLYPAIGLTCPVLVVGDSISAAYGIKTSQGWVALLEQKMAQENMPCKVINSSISGDTTAGGLARIGRELSVHHPKILIIELGGNDGLRGISPKITKSNLQKMINLAMESGARVLLMEIQIPPNYGKTYRDWLEKVYRQLVSEMSIEWIPKFLAGIGDHPQFMQQDGIHPNPEGQKLIVDKVWPVLKKMVDRLSAKRTVPTS